MLQLSYDKVVDIDDAVFGIAVVDIDGGFRDVVESSELVFDVMVLTVAGDFVLFCAWLEVVQSFVIVCIVAHKDEAFSLFAIAILSFADVELDFVL